MVVVSGLLFWWQQRRWLWSACCRLTWSTFTLPVSRSNFMHATKFSPIGLAAVVATGGPLGSFGLRRGAEIERMSGVIPLSSAALTSAPAARSILTTCHV